MDDKQKKILIVAALVVIAIVVYLFVSKKNDDQQGDAVADAMQQAADKVAQAAQANSDTAKQIESNNSTSSKKKWVCAGWEPNDGTTVYLAPGKSAEILNDNSGSAKKTTISAPADGGGVCLGAIKQHPKSPSFWKFTSIDAGIGKLKGISVDHWLEKSKFRDKQNLYYLS